jgi:uncharacterized protein (TIGR00369 family)
MPEESALLDTIRAINVQAGFNRWAGFEVTRAIHGEAEIQIPWRADLGQYSGFLHAGVIGSLIDTACGFAAVTVVGRVIASHFSVSCLAPAVGERFIAIGRVSRAGKRQIFASAELHAVKGTEHKLVATGEALLMPVIG